LAGNFSPRWTPQTWITRRSLPPLWNTWVGPCQICEPTAALCQSISILCTSRYESQILPVDASPLEGDSTPDVMCGGSRQPLLGQAAPGSARLHPLALVPPRLGEDSLRAQRLPTCLQAPAFASPGSPGMVSLLLGSHSS
jgi:hypothetical protein